MRIFAKEMKEFFRTYKIYVVPGIFLLFGFASPIITKLLPELLGSMVEEMGFPLPEMTWEDSYSQFFKNVYQIGILAVILTTMGTIADERGKGVAQLVLTKPVSRNGYVLAKYAANLLIMSITALLAFHATWLYTKVLFDGTQYLSGLYATGIFIVYLAVILALMIFSSSLTKTPVASGGIAVLGLFITSILSLFSKGLNKYSPGALVEYTNQVLGGTANTTELGCALLVALGTCIALLALACFIFQRQEL